MTRALGPSMFTGFDPSPPAFVRPLLAALSEPARCDGYDAAQWDRVIPLARSARLLGVLAARLIHTIDTTRLDERVQRHLQSGLLEARFRRQKTLHLLHAITPLLHGHAGPWVLLKGAAYIAQDLPIAHGRLPSDVDLMVLRAALDGIEQSLLAAGWEFEKTDAYDQHYYRDWSHELPPMQAAGQALELDLHHTILPPIGRIRPDTAGLFARAVPLPNSPFHVLDPLDQLLHAVVHLVHDSDMVGRLRDLLDIDGLMRRADLAQQAHRELLIERAALHGMPRPLWLAASLAERWFGTSGCAELAQEISARAPLVRTVGWVMPLASRVLGPPPLDGCRGPLTPLAGRLLEARAQWLRMPPWTLAYHAASKALRHFQKRDAPAADTPA
ncbi:MAG: nucleotidyltransferase family protein [Burkholderiaceae bacterium]|nr:nucleotidyltransferase family protein [Burkholderiaceae bacterium]